MISDHEVYENVVATVVDVTSVMVAYSIGIQQSSFVLGLAYAVFDAIVVVWLRKPITRMIRSVIAMSGRRPDLRDRYVADIS
jgi:hypothetical protein